MRFFRLTTGLVMLGTVGFACKSSTNPPTPVPTTITLSVASVSLTALGATASIAATVKDQDGQPMTDQTVSWASADASVATVTASGLTATITSVANGQTTVTATSGSLSAQVPVGVDQIATQLVKFAGDGQTGTVGQALAESLVVELRDSRGNVVPGGTGGQLANSQVTFAVATGGGSVTQATAEVGTDGRAKTVWVLGGPAGAQSVTATTAGGGATVSFAATGTAAAGDSIIKAGGDSQSGAAGFELTDSIVVRVFDEYGNVSPGQTVNFAVTTGGGSVSSTSKTTGANGNASVAWTLGMTPGAQTLTATATGLTGSPLTFTAIASTADSMAVAQGDNQTGAISVALPESVIVRVLDQFGAAFAGHKVGFTVLSGGGSVSADTVVTGTNGQAGVVWTLGASIGLQELTVEAVGVSKNSPVTIQATGVAQVATTFEKAASDSLIGLVGKPINIPPAVRIKDQLGNPMAGESVTFAVTGGGGTVQGGGSANLVTDADGIARVTDWTIGGSAGANALQVTSGALTALNFAATGQVAAFNIEVRFYGDSSQLTQGAKDGFAAAEALWETLIFGDLQAAVVNVATGFCGGDFSDHPAVNETVDDLVILAKIEPIDGPGGTLGAAGPCLVRGSGPQVDLPALGVMRFDSADVATYVSNGTFDEIVLHEMGHVLGFTRTIWTRSSMNLLVNECPSVTNCTTDPRFVGNRAIAAFDRIGGTAYTAGAKVPVEDCLSGVPSSCGGGTITSHWRERVFDTELMTGYLDATAPLSILTLAAFWDMRYLVNFADANSFTWTGSSAGLRASAAVIDLGNDIHDGPLYAVDAAGRIRLLRP